MDPLGGKIYRLRYLFVTKRARERIFTGAHGSEPQPEVLLIRIQTRMFHHFPEVNKPLLAKTMIGRTNKRQGESVQHNASQSVLVRKISQ